MSIPDKSFIITSIIIIAVGMFFLSMKGNIMKPNPFCMCCAVNKQEHQIRQFDDMARKTEYMKNVMRIMADAGDDECIPSLSVRLNRFFSEYWNVPGRDYTSVKKEFNQLMLGMEDSIEEKIRQSDEPLQTALLYARIGNYIDFAALSDVSPETVLELLNDGNQKPLDPQIYKDFRADLSRASRLVYLTDNCGEIVLDKIVIKLLKEMYPDLQIHVIVRGLPAVNDTTVEDAEEIGLTAIVPVVGNGSDVCGTWLPRISPESRSLIDSADIMISKGQGNYETLHGCGLNIYYLFLCKCEWFQLQFHAEPLQGMFLNERHIVAD